MGCRAFFRVAAQDLQAFKGIALLIMTQLCCHTLQQSGNIHRCPPICPLQPTGIALAPDGLRLAVGTDTGALSLLDIRSQTYVTLLRSHTAPVAAISLMGQQPGQEQQEGRRYCTGGRDGTVRVWDGDTHQQLVELAAPGEAVLR